jgi:hypothetical protein
MINLNTSLSADEDIICLVLLYCLSSILEILITYATHCMNKDNNDNKDFGMKILCNPRFFDEFDEDIAHEDDKIDDITSLSAVYSCFVDVRW